MDVGILNGGLYRTFYRYTSGITILLTLSTISLPI